MTLCELHLCHYGERVKAKGLDSLTYRKITGQQQPHDIPSQKEPFHGLNREYGKRRNRTCLMVMQKMAPHLGYVHFRHTSYLTAKSTGVGEATNRAVTAKRSKYATINLKLNVNKSRELIIHGRARFDPPHPIPASLVFNSFPSSALS